MKFLLLTDDEPMYLPRYLQPIIEEHHDLLVEVVIAPHPSDGLKETIKNRFRMFGFLPFLRYGSRFAYGKLLSVLPRSISAKFNDQYFSVQSLVNSYAIPVRTEPNVNSPAFISHVKELDPDVILSIACSQKLNEELLTIPENGAINIHGSLLPKYRGRATAFWVLFHGEEESGVTAHYMANRFDGGDIIMQRRYEIEPDDSMDDVYDKTVEKGSQLAIDLLSALSEGSVPEPTPNPVDEGEYYSLPGQKERREFKRRGNKFL
jgi:folate-dependent phosphoribosylglycinamide formyltransferase PurN